MRAETVARFSSTWRKTGLHLRKTGNTPDPGTGTVQTPNPGPQSLLPPLLTP